MNEAPPPYQALEEPNSPQYSGQHPPQEGYQAGGTVVLQPTCTIVHVYREVPCRVQCQYCGKDVLTTVHYEAGTLTWIVCFFLCLLCPFFFWVPFCIFACQDAVHTCPNCHNIVGRYNRM